MQGHQDTRRACYPVAIRDTLNKAAWETFNGSRDEIGRRFFERNTWTRKSVRFKQAKGRDIGRMQSEVGSLQAYMRDQETGFTRRKKGIHGVAIPTSATTGEGQVRKRTKVIQRRNYLNRIKPPRGRVRGKSRSIVAIKEAVKSGKRTVFINQAEDQWGRPTRFYRVLGGRRKGGRWPKGAKLQMIYSTEARHREDGSPSLARAGD